MFPDLPGRIVVHVGQILLHPAPRIQLRLQRQPTAATATAAAVHRTKHRHLPIKDDCLVVVVVVALQRHAALSTIYLSQLCPSGYIAMEHTNTPTPLVYPILFWTLSLYLSVAFPVL